MYFRVNLKMKKPTLFCCFTDSKLNFTAAFRLIGKTWKLGMTDLQVKVGEWGILRNGGILVIGGGGGVILN